MNRKPQDLDQVLDQAIAEIRDSKLDPAAERAAGEKVWQQLDAALRERAVERGEGRSIRDCAGFQALIPAYVAGALSDSKALLVKDHVGECITCRRALRQARAKRPVGRETPQARKSWLSGVGVRVAAAAVFFFFVIGLTINTDLLVIEAGGLVRIERVDGEAFRVTDEGNVPLRAGDEISFADVKGIRTAKGSTAMLRMSDDSLVEMDERAELAVKNRRPIWKFGAGQPLIELDRGNIIVEAADRDAGQLLVDTADARVAADDSVLAVNHGIKGSRVSVIRGQAEVAQAGRTAVLLTGQQDTTRPGLDHVPIESEIAWSQNLERHMAVLREFGRVSAEIAEEIEGPSLRYSTALLDMAPADTAIYVGIPNLSETLSNAYDLLQQKIEGNELLSTWWDESVVSSGADVELQRVMDRIRDYGDHLGDEIAVTLQANDDGDVENPLIYARLNHPADFRAFLEADLEALAGEVDHGDRGSLTGHVRIFEGELDQPVGGSDGADLNLWIRDGYLALSPDIETLRRFSHVLEPNGRNFASSSFHPRLAELYRQGVEWVVGVDVAALIASDPGAADASLERMGLLDLQNVIAVRKSDGDLKQNRVVLTFDEPRKGLASWLAEPAPMGSLDYISPQANFAAAFVMEEPSSMVDQLFGFINADDADFERELDEFQRQNGIDIRRDVAAALGGEFALAVDGPLLPKPSWKLIVEVYNPAQLQNSLEWAVERINEVASEHDRQGFLLREQARGSRRFYELQSLDTGISAHYTYADGYLVAAASRGLLLRALKVRESGLNVTSSPKFTALLPHDGQVNFSAVVFTDLGSVLGPLAGAISAATSQLPPEQRMMVEQLGSASTPSLTLAYGEPDQIVFVNRSEGGLLTAAIRSLLRLDSMLDVQQLLDEAARQGRNGPQGAGKASDPSTTTPEAPAVDEAIEKSAQG
jgi:ferric-dicitrate binding protein FerR (iron transport regulator)